jgi:hypothetical protein
MPQDDTARALIAALTSKTTADIAALKSTVDEQVAALTNQAVTITALRKDVDALKSPPPPPPPPPPPAWKTLVVKATDTPAMLQAAFDQAKQDLTLGNVELRISPKLTWLGNFVIRADAPTRKAGSVLRVRADAEDANFTSGSMPWIDPSYSPSMAKFGSPNANAAISFEDGAHGVELFGIEGVPNTAWPDRELFTIGRYDATAISMLPSDITLNACYVHGDAVKGQHKGVAFNVKGGKMLRCYFEKFLEVGRDSQAFTVINGTGPLVFDSCYFEAGAENILFGGDRQRIVGLVPTGATFRNCLFFKPQTWRTKNWQIKNLFELKCASDVLVEGCMFDGTWIAGQSGDAILLNVRNQEGDAPWSTLKNITFRQNVIKNAPDGAAFQLMGLDDNPVTCVQGTNLLLEHNLIIGARNGVVVNNGFQPTILRHNTFTNVQEWMLKFTNNPIPNGKFEFTSNVCPSGQYGITGDGTTVGKPSLDAFAPGAIFAKNVIETAPFVNFPAGNYVLPPGTIKTRLDSTGAYTGPELGVDNERAGANVLEISKRMPWAKW